MLERIRPRRKRSIAKFVLTKDNGKLFFSEFGWNVERIPAQSFSQNAESESGDVRSLKRVFPEMSGRVTSNQDFWHLLLSLAHLVISVHRHSIREITITAHQVSIFAELEHDGDNAPEGIHQDGSDYIVSALVVERDGILGGQSIVYGADKKTELLRHTLIPGEGLFQADKNSSLWHDVTPIREDPDIPPTYGKRSIFGFDIDVTDEG